MTTAVLLLMSNMVGLGLDAVTTGILSDLYRAGDIAEPLTWALLSIDAVSVFTIVSFIVGSVYWQRQQDALELNVS